MTDYLLIAILVVQVLILLQGNRTGQELGRTIDKIVYKYRTWRFERRQRRD